MLEKTVIVFCASAAGRFGSINSNLVTCRKVAVGSFAALVLVMTLSRSASADAISASDFSSIMGEIKSSIRDEKDAKKEVDKVQRDADDWLIKMEQHNANVCRGDGCDWYDQEKVSLENERIELIKRMYPWKQKLEYAKSRVQTLIGKLRISAFLGCLQPFAADIQRCAAMSDEAAAECLSEVWANSCR